MSLDLEPIKGRHGLFASADLDHEGMVYAISAATDVPFLLAEVESLRKERDEAKERVLAFHGHSVLLNSVSYRISEALAQTKGAEGYVGNPIEDVERLIADRFALAEQVARVRALHSADTRVGIVGEQCAGCSLRGVGAVFLNDCRTLAALAPPVEKGQET